ncbi:hypothetical protein BRADI_4g08290v3 [Brachypodium distachyon]|uniref:Disease resistance protein At4g27190-like leucine-rich repeats domain-containing protein n=1 Tax=Brachypodium distachyon TaxID=15368 RepID=A0A0Q3H0R1_BRADI|nr:hypothetical protein BRADI_4g08290v3 [Brachypodium distachyon]
MSVQGIIHLLEDNREEPHYIDPWENIYFDGSDELATSAVLRAIAEDPPASLKKKFDSIIHLDCSRWKSRRWFQRTIVEKLELPQHVLVTLDTQDKEDDFRMVDEGSRNEIRGVARAIHQALQGRRCLFIFHIGSNGKIDFSDFGIPEPKWSRDTKVLWTLRGRLRLNTDIAGQVKDSRNYLTCYLLLAKKLDSLLRADATEIARYTHKLGATTEIAAECFLYLLSLKNMGGDTIAYNRGTHACNYWVCDGIISGSQVDEAWEVGNALYQVMQFEDYSHMFGYSVQQLRTHSWISKNIERTQINVLTIPQETSSFFLAIRSGSDQAIPSLPSNMFQQSEKLRVLKLCYCTFSFSLPPFYPCHGLRFLAIDSCKDRQEAEAKQERPALECFENLWVLDICETDWELDLSSKITEQMAKNIREVHIKRGRIWCGHLAWRRLHNLRRIRSGNKDEFTHMVMLELLDLSGNCMIQVLQRLSEATCLKTLVLDGCIGLEHVGPEVLPPSLESFSLDAGSSQKDEAKVSKISLVSWVHSGSFTLGGSLPSLEELDLSGTSIRKLNLNDAVVKVPKLERIFLVGCKKILATPWWKEKSRVKVLHISHQVKDAIRLRGSSSVHTESRKHDGQVCVRDARFIHSLKLTNELITNSLYLNLESFLGRKTKGRSRNNMGIDTNRGKVVLPVRSGSNCYNDVLVFLGVVADVYEVPDHLPLNYHVEISDGINLTDLGSWSGSVIGSLILGFLSLDDHDNFSILHVFPKASLRTHQFQSSNLKWCRVERCPKLQEVFAYHRLMCHYSFPELETIWVVDLLTASCIWSRGVIAEFSYEEPFGKLRSIHLHGCPRLKFILPISQFTLPSLETLHIVHCGDLKHVFPWKENYKASKRAVKKFPKLKHIHLHDLPSLQLICEAKMFAPELKMIKLRGCWNLRRIPAINCHRRDGCPIVECEDLCQKLEWDGLETGHHPSLFETQHSSHYRKPMPRTSVLR